jgi:hypothetical protein
MVRIAIKKEGNILNECLTPWMQLHRILISNDIVSSREP